MIHRIVQAALRQKFVVLMFTAFITVGGILSFQRMPVDAYPDLSPPQVKIITQWPDHAVELLPWPQITRTRGCHRHRSRPDFPPLYRLFRQPRAL